MRGQVGFDQNTSDAELIALVRGAQHDTDVQRDDVNALLRDFAEELLKQRLLAKMNSVRPMESSRAKVGYTYGGPSHGNDVHERLSARAADAVFSANAKISRFRERLLVLAHQAEAYFRQAYEHSAKLAARVAEKGRMQREQIRSRLPVVLEQARTHLRGAHEHSAKVTASVAEKGRMLQERVRLRVPVVLEQARTHLRGAYEHSAKQAASVAEKGRMLQERVRLRVPVVLEQARTHLRGAYEHSAKVTASVAEKGRMLREQIRSRLPIVLEQTRTHLRQAHEHSAKVTARVAEKRRMLQERIESRLPIALEQAKGSFREVHDHSTKLAASATDRQRKLREALRLKENNLHALFADALGRGLEASRSVRGHETRFPAALKQAKVRFRQAENKFKKLASNVVGKPKKPRENDLQQLLSSSQDAVVVTSVDHRFVAANPRALSLFGISERNMKMFTIDAFLSRRQIPLFDEIGASFTSGKERCGECKIRRLDGSSGVAEYIFVANYVPFLHVCRFHNYRKWTLRRRFAAS